MIDKDREVSNMIDKAVGQYYDLETIVGNNNLNYISFSPHDLKQCKLKKYQYAKLVNINGLGIGQVHFITEDGHYLMLPWCYIGSMIASKEIERQHMEFKTSKKLDKWVENHRKQGCVSHATAGEQFVYEFLPSGIVECQTVKCLCCGKKFTDYVD